MTTLDEGPLRARHFLRGIRRDDDDGGGGGGGDDYRLETTQQ